MQEHTPNGKKHRTPSDQSTRKSMNPDPETRYMDAEVARIKE
jgi:hypothetical protein